MSDKFKVLGQILRFPFFIIGCIIWAFTGFQIILFFSVFCIIAHPICFPIAFLYAAFLGEGYERFKNDFWNDYPYKYIKWLKIGYEGLYEWLLRGEGF